MKAIRRFEAIQKAHINVELVNRDDVEFLIKYVNELIGKLDLIKFAADHFKLETK